MASIHVYKKMFSTFILIQKKDTNNSQFILDSMPSLFITATQFYRMNIFLKNVGYKMITGQLGKGGVQRITIK